MRAEVQREDWHRDGVREGRLSGLAARGVPAHDQPQERIEHEAPP